LIFDAKIIQNILKMQEKYKKNTKISEKIKQIIDIEGIKPNQFALKLGYKRSQTVYDILNCKSAPSYDFFLRFQNSEYSAKYELKWLIAGENLIAKAEHPECKDDVQPELEAPSIKYQLPKQGIPLIPAAAMAGAFNEDIQVLEHEGEHYIVPMFKDADFLISVKGSSMVPKYNSGDIIACKKLPLDTFFQWDKVYVLDTDQGALVKRIKKCKDQDKVLIVSDNPSSEPFELERKRIYHIALVIGVIRLE
jgi:repressor LexA